MSKYDFHFFQNTSCRYFPCHADIPIDDFNCMHCYCPLYFVEDCGGDPLYTESGVRDCSACTKPHDKQGWTWIRDRINELVGNTTRFSEIVKQDTNPPYCSGCVSLCEGCKGKYGYRED